ncbi:amino acid ABC transporter permease [Enterovirga rhinocerotis]|uniref:L-glutamate ABC transporter membrane protein /L-aspartate ABC transporter membrane protein n=1 Tax=Enterovirga rhinocerotis TaxID=1339210 RepID=A0A4R7C5W9_9HYPH|nr:amino acid ABC transporter permease [Enterovirga rhinocerotis]TDR93621.1 L-glutamate ABC transporter membrane protein /L-aspartate ABC transporter membrane protein [Enterovirga rhinocerotis]
MSYNWNWGILLEQSPEGIGSYLYTLWLGLQWTMLVAAGAWILALAVGSVLGVARSLPGRWFSPLATAYVEIFRNIPLLVQLFLWYFVMPELLPRSWGLWVKQLPNAPLYTAILGIGLYMGSRVGEQLRAGIQALPRGQMMAATAIGLTVPQAFRFVILPQAYRIILPPLTSEFLNTIKNTSVALTIGLLELTARARAMQEYSFQVFEAFTAATVLYLLLNIAVTFAMRLIESRVAVPGLGVLKK